MIYTENDLKNKCLELLNGKPVPVLGHGPKRFGDTLEAFFKVDTNNRSTSDIQCLDMELKAKVDEQSDLTLFSTKPHFLRLDSGEFFRIHKRIINDSESLYTDVSSKINTFNLQLVIQETDEDHELIIRDAARNSNRASINFGHIKHMANMKMRNLLLGHGELLNINNKEFIDFHTVEIFTGFCLTNQKIRRFILDNKMIYSFRQRFKKGKFKDHGSAFRLTDAAYLRELYTSYEIISKNE